MVQYIVNKSIELDPQPTLAQFPPAYNQMREMESEREEVTHADMI